VQIHEEGRVNDPAFSFLQTIPVDPINYQRIRLWSGITSIGANLALIWGLASLAQRKPTWLLPVSGGVPRLAEGR